MSVRSAKDAIREARLKAGLTQEQLAEGICSLQALSRIESGTSGVSPATFQALMEHAGAACERFPTFAGRKDFECYCSLKYARFHLEAWQLRSAWEELQKLEDRNWADNKLYYQEWLLLHCELQFYSYCCPHGQNYETLLAALHITRPHIDLSDFRGLLLSQNEIRLLTFLAQEALYLGDTERCSRIGSQLDVYLAESKFSAAEKNQMRADLAVVQTKYLIAAKDYRKALQTAESARREIVRREDITGLITLTFLTGLCCYYTGEQTEAALYIKAAFYSAHAIGSCYATVCREYLLTRTEYPMSDYMKSLPDIPATSYALKPVRDISVFSDGVYSANAAENYTLGSLIRELRQEQKLSQQIVCRGLCSKSKLSKIENGFLQPDIALAEALLQRLGLSERIFTFWGTEKDAKFHDLKFKLLDIQHLQKQKAEPYLREMALLIDEDDTLYRQEYLMHLADFSLFSSEERIAALTEALHCTLPDFDIHSILRYRLSWQEISILNMIAFEYRNTRKSYLSLVYFCQLFDYKNKVNPSMQLQISTFAFTLKLHYQSLYSQGHFNDILELHAHCDTALLKHNPNAYASVLFYYCQALGECGLYEEVTPPAVYSCSLEFLVGLSENSDLLKRYLHEDFSIDVID